MDAETLFNLGFEHWPALLLSAIPATVTLASIVYFSRFPAYRINKVYLLYLLSIFAWQTNDSLSRMSLSAETAQSWDRILAIPWILQFPSCIHFAVLLSGRRRLGNRSLFIILLYFPTVIFAILLCAGACSQKFHYVDFWGWVKIYNGNDRLLTGGVIWVCMQITSALILFCVFAYKSRRSPDAKFIFLYMFLGYSIPAIQGTFTELVFPLILNIDPVPLTSTLMLTVVLVMMQLNAYKMFNLSETMDTERITEIIQEIFFVVSSKRVITYVNPYGAKAMGIKEKERSMVSGLFKDSTSAYEAFEKKILIPSFKKTNPSSVQFSWKDKSKKETFWDIATYPIFHRKSVEGLLVMCRDISDHVLMAETRLAALRSQMNPHFIFNSLNSIQHYIHNNQREKAESFLSMFSILIRKTLDASAKSAIPLSDELDTIRLYLNLEKFRFGSLLNYEIHTANDLDIENTLIPSMLIQPYVENAIVHGLAPKEGGGRIIIQLTRVNESILCVVKDDGIGREKSIQMKSRTTIKTKSHGMSITQARLEILNRHLNVPVSVRVVSLSDDQDQQSGTQVEIFIPVNERF